MRIVQAVSWCGVAVALVMFVSLWARAEEASPGAAKQPTLKQAAGEKLLMGCAISASDLDNPGRAQLIATQFNCITAGNEFKPLSLQREKGKFTFEQADKIADFAQQHGMKMI